MKLEGRSDYTVYNTPKGRLAFRLTDHSAQGDNFIQDEADVNISVFVSYHSFDPNASRVEFTEYEFDSNYFDSHRKQCINIIINAVHHAILTGVFEIDSSVANKVQHPTTEDIQRAEEKERRELEKKEQLKKDKKKSKNHENSNYNDNNNNLKKRLYESIMKDVTKIIKKSLLEYAES